MKIFIILQMDQEGLKNLLTKGRCFLTTERVSDSLRQGNMCSFSVRPSIANLSPFSEMALFVKPYIGFADAYCFVAEIM